MESKNLTQTYSIDHEARAQLKEAIAESAKLVEKNVLGFVLVLVYLVLTIFTTDDMAFVYLNDTANLPILDLPVPTIGIFIAAPTLMVALHFQVLFVLNNHNKHLLNYAAVCTEAELDLLPASLANALPRMQGFRYLALLFFQWTLLVCIPLVFIILVQYKISAFRSVWITALQTLLMLVEVVLIRKMWMPPLPSRFSQTMSSRSRKLTQLLRGSAKRLGPVTFALVLFSLLNLTALSLQEYFLGRFHHTMVGRISRYLVNDLTLTRRNILDGPIKERIGSERSDMRGRNLGFAVFFGSDLAGMDLSGGALRGADLREAKLDQTIMEETVLLAANLQNASLRMANLNRADLSFADLRDADLTGADLRQANLTGARLEGATLNGALLTDAILDHANMNNVQAVATIFNGASMVETSLRQGLLQCSIFASAKMRYADLSFAYCHGSDFMDADLRHASLQYSQLQGAYLGFVRMRETDLSGAEVSGTVFQPKDAQDERPRFYLNVPPDQVTKVNWARIRQRHAQRLPEDVHSRNPRELFEVMLKAGQERSVNQTPVRFDVYQDHMTEQVQTAGPKQLEETDKRVLRILTMSNAGMVEPLRMRATEFSNNLDDVRIEVIGLPTLELPEVISADMAGGNAYHGYVILPSWISEYAAQGLLLDLSNRVLADRDLDFYNILPLYRFGNACYEDAEGCKRVFAVPLDGDMHLLYYRTDLISEEQAPRTWEDYLALAELITAKYDPDDANGGVYGSVMPNSTKDQSYALLWSVAHAYLQTQGMQEGSFFDQDSMEPLVDNASFQEVLGLYRRIIAQGPRDENGRPRTDITIGEANKMFMSGKAAMLIGWSGVGTMERFRKFNQIRATILPGSDRVLNRQTGELETVTPDNSPHALRYEDRMVNHAPYAAANGWSGVIRQDLDARDQEILYQFFSFVSSRQQSRQDVTGYNTNINPFRHAHLFQNESWRESEINLKFLDTYLAALRDSLENPNLVIDLQINDTSRYLFDAYQEIIHPRIFEDNLRRPMQLESMRSLTQTLATFMNQVTEENGRDDQIISFRQSLTSTPCPCLESGARKEEN